MELPHIGQTCVICNRNDYLPFKCSRCDKIVCIDHKTNHGSDCPLGQSSFQADLNQPTESIKQACDYCHRITLKLELVECNHCGHKHCLYHRHQVQHKCPQLDSIKETKQLENQSRAERQREALDRLKSQVSAKSTHQQQVPIDSRRYFADPKKQALARRIRLMKIKQTARGPPNILDADKLFFELKFVHQPKSTLSKGDKDGATVRFFTTAKHTVGRMVDWSADELGVDNKNHQANADQLCFMFDCCPNQDQDDRELAWLDNEKTFQYYLDSDCLASGDQLAISYRKN